jgi:hypothetical protein
LGSVLFLLLLVVRFARFFQAAPLLLVVQAAVDEHDDFTAARHYKRPEEETYPLTGGGRVGKRPREIEVTGPVSVKRMRSRKERRADQWEAMCVACGLVQLF